MNKEQFTRQYIIGFISSTSAAAINHATIHEDFSIIEDVAKEEVLADQIGMASLLAERTWERLLKEGVLDLEDE